MSAPNNHRGPRPLRGAGSILFGPASQRGRGAYLITFLAAASILSSRLDRVRVIPELGAVASRIRLVVSDHAVWDPVAGRFGALPFIYGTLLTSALALLQAIPLGLAQPFSYPS